MEHSADDETPNCDASRQTTLSTACSPVDGPFTKSSGAARGRSEHRLLTVSVSSSTRSSAHPNTQMSPPPSIMITLPAVALIANGELLRKPWKSPAARATVSDSLAGSRGTKHCNRGSSGTWHVRTRGRHRGGGPRHGHGLVECNCK